jgi:hypothetical protein
MRLDGETWAAVPGASQTYSTTVEPNGSVTVPIGMTLDGMLADTPAVRLQIGLAGVDFVGGQARKTYEEFAGPAITCPPVTGIAGKENYKVVLGDTLARVATLTKTSVEDLAGANGLGADSPLIIGQALTIPKTAVKPATTTTSGPATRGTVAPGEPSSRSTRQPAGRTTPTPTDEAAVEETATPTPTEEATKTRTADAVTTTVAGGEPPADPTGGEPSGGGLEDMLLPLGMGLVGIFVIGASGLGIFMMIRRLRAGGGGRPAVPAAAGIAGIPAAAPAAVAPPVQQQPVAKKAGTKENPAAIPLTGDMKDLLGLERNRSAVAKAFAPEPEAVAPSSQLLSEARELARILGRTA